MIGISLSLPGVAALNKGGRVFLLTFDDVDGVEYFFTFDDVDGSEFFAIGAV